MLEKRFDDSLAQELLNSELEFDVPTLK